MVVIPSVPKMSTGFTTVQRPNRVIIARKGTKQVVAMTSQERGQLVTVCCTINAVGNTVRPFQGLNCQKISGGGVDICLFIVIVITHRQFSIINNGGGLRLTPPGYPRASCLGGGGLSKQLGGFNPPNNSNTAPFMVYPRVYFKQHMIIGAPPRTAGSAHPSGWMTASTFVLYLEHFIQYVKCSPRHPVLLRLVNHESH
jgi:hypothetical protein